MKTILKSIGACSAGIFVGAALSIGTDKILEAAGILPHGNLWVSNALIVFVIFYRTVFNVLGAYVVARLAPNHPLRHALAVGVLGTILCILGVVASAQMNLGPSWYAWALAVLALPSTWIGGKFYVNSLRKK